VGVKGNERVLQGGCCDCRAGSSIGGVKLGSELHKRLNCEETVRLKEFQSCDHNKGGGSPCRRRLLGKRGRRIRQGRGRIFSR
jgi:hypothetical protein